MTLRTVTKKSPKKPLVFTVVIIIVLLAGFFVYAFLNNIWPFTQSAKKDTTTTIHSKGKPATAKDNESKLIQKGGNQSQGRHSTDGTGVVDTGGTDAPQRSGGVQSKSGAITLYSPTSGQTLKNGTKISGKSTLSQVQYRIFDTIHGQIAQGTLKVHNGLFSGNLALGDTDAKSGTFEVYNFDSQGVEENNIRVDIRF